MLQLPLPERVADLPVSWERVVWMDRPSRALRDVMAPVAIGGLGVIGLAVLVVSVMAGELGVGLLALLSFGTLAALGVGLPRLGCDVSQHGVRIHGFLVPARVVPWNRAEIGFHRHPGNIEQVAITDRSSGMSKPIPNTPRVIGSTDVRARRLGDFAAQLAALAADGAAQQGGPPASPRTA